MGNYGIFLIMGNAGFIPSTMVGTRVPCSIPYIKSRRTMMFQASGSTVA